MNDRQENKMSMYLVVQKICNFYATVWSGLIAFVNAFNNFESIIQQIKDIRLLQEGSIKGITMEKKEAEDDLITKVYIISTAVYAYAEDINDRKLQQKVNYSLTKYKSARDTILRDLCQLIHNEADKIIGNLADYGVTAATLTELQDAIDIYVNTISEPRQAIVSRAEATAQLEQLIQDANNILTERMDKLVEHFSITNKNFYLEYKRGRNIIESGGGGTPGEKIKITMSTNQTNPDKVTLGYKGANSKVVDTKFGDGNSKSTTMDGTNYLYTGNTYLTGGNYTITAEVEKSALNGIVASGDMLTAVNHPDGLDAEEYDYSNNDLTSIFFLPTNTRAKKIDVSGNNLDQQSMNLIMMTADGWGTSNGYIKADGGTNAPPSGQGIVAKNALIAKGWTVITN